MHSAGLEANSIRLAGLDNLHSKIVQEMVHDKAGPVERSFNKPFEPAVVPSDWKTANVIFILGRIMKG